MSPIPMAWWLVLGIGVVTSSSENRRSKSSCLFKGEAKRRDKLIWRVRQRSRAAALRADGGSGWLHAAW